MKINIYLPQEYEARVRDYVSSGRFGSPSEVICEALRLLDIYQGLQQRYSTALKEDIGKGLADAAAGRVRAVDMDAVMAEGRSRRENR